MDENENPFSAKLGPALDVVNLSAQEAMSSLGQYGGKEIVIVENNGSHWKGKLMGYNFMYIQIFREGESMKILSGNIDKILVDVEEANAPESK